MNSPPTEKLAAWEAVMIVLNCGVAVGIYGLPWAFSQVGWALAIGFSIFYLILLSFLAMLIVQIQTRMTVLQTYSSQGYSIAPVPVFELFKDHPPEHYLSKDNQTSENALRPEPATNETQPLLEKRNSEPVALATVPLDRSYSESDKHTALTESRKLDRFKIFKTYDLTLTCGIMLGKNMTKIMISLLVFTNIITIIGAISLFATTMTSTIPIGPFDTCDIEAHSGYLNHCRYKYTFYIIIAAVIATAMSYYVKFAEQKAYIIGVSFGRIFLIAVIIITALICRARSVELDDNDEIDVDNTAVDLMGIGVGAPIMFSVLSFHIFIPTILKQLGDVKQSINVFFVSLITEFVLILALGLCCVLLIEDVEQAFTLNWDNYSNGESDDDRKWWTFVVAVFVSIYPAFDVSCILGMFVQNTAENICSFRYENLQEYESDEKVVRKMMVVVLAVAIIIAIAFSKFGIIIAIAGLAGMALLMILIPMMGLASIILVPKKCVVDNSISNKKLLKGVIVFSVICVMTVWIVFILYLITD
jgi:hypothetical protein